jgi:hypothetical protein
MLLITYIKNSDTYIEDFLYVSVHLFCYIVHWEGLLLEKPETNYYLCAHKNWLLRQTRRYIYTNLETAIKLMRLKFPSQEITIHLLNLHPKERELNIALCVVANCVIQTDQICNIRYEHIDVRDHLCHTSRSLFAKIGLI